MIEFLKTGNYGLVQHYVLTILVMWVVMVAAVCVDLWAGVNSAKARGEKIYSVGFGGHFRSWGIIGAFR